MNNNNNNNMNNNTKIHRFLQKVTKNLAKKFDLKLIDEAKNLYDIQIIKNLNNEQLLDMVDSLLLTKNINQVIIYNSLAEGNYSLKMDMQEIVNDIMLNISTNDHHTVTILSIDSSNNIVKVTYINTEQLINNGSLLDDLINKGVVILKN